MTDDQIIATEQSDPLIDAVVDNQIDQMGEIHDTQDDVSELAADVAATDSDVTSLRDRLGTIETGLTTLGSAITERITALEMGITTWQTNLMQQLSQLPIPPQPSVTNPPASDDQPDADADDDQPVMEVTLPPAEPASVRADPGKRRLRRAFHNRR